MNQAAEDVDARLEAKVWGLQPADHPPVRASVGEISAGYEKFMSLSEALVQQMRSELSEV